MDRQPSVGWSRRTGEGERGGGGVSMRQMMCRLVVNPKVRASVERMSGDFGKVEVNSAIVKR